MTYRDGLGPRWQQLRSEIEIAQARLEQISPATQKRAPEQLRARLDAASELGRLAPSTLAEIEEAEGALADLRAALDEIEALAKEEERAPVVAPADGTVQGTRPSSLLFDLLNLGQGRDFAENAAQLARILTRYGAAPHWTGPLSVEATFQHRGASYLLVFRHQTSNNFDREPPGEKFLLSTDGIPLDAPAFEITPQTGFGDLLQALHLKLSPSVGDETFDVTFSIAGDLRCVTLLVPEVRNALLSMTREDVPSLTVHGGRALLSWSAPPSDALLSAALRALAALRVGGAREGMPPPRSSANWPRTLATIGPTDAQGVRPPRHDRAHALIKRTPLRNGPGRRMLRRHEGPPR